MKILYGVVGEGMGHAMRSRVVLEHLVGQGHELSIMASGRATDFLAKHFTGVNRIHGLHMIYEENRVRRGKTLWSNVLTGATGVPQNIAAYFDLIKDFKPELVVSDFESWTYLYAKLNRLPILSIDNMQIINRCTHAPSIVAGYEAEFQVTKAFIKGKLPFCNHYLITTFFQPPVRKPETTLRPPSCARRSSRPTAAPASTCSSTRPPRATTGSSTSSRRRASPAASTACGAISTPITPRATSSSAPSARPASSTIWRRAGASSRAAGSPSWARPCSSASRCSRSRSSTSSSR